MNGTVRRYRGWWCPWCSTWVDKKDIDVIGGSNLHSECGYTVERRTSDRPVVPSPPSPEVKAAQARHAQMVSDFIREAI